MGPGLFTIFMNDLMEVMGCTPVKFADGTNLGGPLNTLEGRGCRSEGPRQARGRGQQKLHEIQQGQMQSPASGKEEPLNDTDKVWQRATMMVQHWSACPVGRG